MARVRLTATTVLLLILALGVPAAAAPGAGLRLVASEALAEVAWPPSSGLLVAEVVTGGTSASDEYIELTNASSTPVDLAGLEVVYVTSSGATVTRKASLRVVYWARPPACVRPICVCVTVKGSMKMLMATSPSE